MKFVTLTTAALAAMIIAAPAYAGSLPHGYNDENGTRASVRPDASSHGIALPNSAGKSEYRYENN